VALSLGVEIDLSLSQLCDANEGVLVTMKRMKLAWGECCFRIGL
jgi:hypothetical protein